jgi:hypothetical protein
MTDLVLSSGVAALDECDGDAFFDSVPTPLDPCV